MGTTWLALWLVIACPVVCELDSSPRCNCQSGTPCTPNNVEDDHSCFCGTPAVHEPFASVFAAIDGHPVGVLFLAAECSEPNRGVNDRPPMCFGGALAGTARRTFPLLM
jgi:hypothetical protein